MIDNGRFAVLGPLVVRDDAGAELALNSPKQRALLAAPLVRPNLIVPADELVELIWPDGGDGAQATLRSYVMRLRRSLGPLGTRLETIAPGYRFTLDEERELDLTAFTRLSRAGRAAAQAGDWARAAEGLGRALELWRGEPLLDVACPPLHDRSVPPLIELHRQVRELHCEAELELGRPGEAVADLQALIRDEPLRERPYAVLMTALSRLERRAEALDDAIMPRRPDTLITLDHLPEGLPPLPEFADTFEAVAWGRAEELNIRAAVRLAAASADRRLWELGWQVPYVLRYFYINEREVETAIDLMAVGAGLARRLENLEHESRVRTNLAILLLQAGRFEEAIEHLERNLAVWSELDRPKEVEQVRVNLGIAFAELGRLDAAAAEFEQVLVYSQEIGDIADQYRAWSNIAELRRRAGDVTGALEACDQAEELVRAAHEEGRQIPFRNEILQTKAECLREVGRLAPAAEAADQSARLRRALGDRRGLLESLRLQGECLAELGHPRAAALLAEADELELELKAD